MEFGLVTEGKNIVKYLRTDENTHLYIDKVNRTWLSKLPLKCNFIPYMIHNLILQLFTLEGNTKIVHSIGCPSLKFDMNHLISRDPNDISSVKLGSH